MESKLGASDACGEGFLYQALELGRIRNKNKQS